MHSGSASEKSVFCSVEQQRLHATGCISCIFGKIQSFKILSFALTRFLLGPPKELKALPSRGMDNRRLSVIKCIT